ncbi:MAG TPA: DUF1501 domain-containing protein [Pirellulaceae bacterium]|nr:DUF1501 domain-containing protein [Pirellulaceae bacterium]
MSPSARSRRNALASIGGGFGAVALASMLERRVAGDDRLDSIDPIAPLRQRRPDRVGRARSVIVIFLVGGPSQVDTFDRKPELDRLDGQPVPQPIREAVEKTKFANVFHGAEDSLMKSPYRFAQYGESGMWISELHPHLAKQVDRLCFIHSLQSDSNNHAPSSYQLHTGDIRPGKASLGSWITYGLGSECENLPGYVTLFDAGPLGGAANYTNGFLPAAFQPTRLRDRGVPVLDLVPPERFAEGQGETFDLIGTLDRRFRESHVATGDLDARIASYELAYRMQSAALEVGDLADEPEYVRREYGIDEPEERLASFARKCLMARRLVERGVRFVQLYDMPDKDGWDAHGALEKNHTPRARWTDRPAAALIEDLHRRGLLDSTLVLWVSEFGRTPMRQGSDGRQHDAAGFTCWMAGGGVREGVRIGATDEIGLMAVERPAPIRDLHATMLTAMGTDYESLSYRVAGRDERLTGVAGSARPIDEVFG